jgi:hypothetical protein
MGLLEAVKAVKAVNAVSGDGINLETYQVGQFSTAIPWGDWELANMHNSKLLLVKVESGK